MHAWAVRCAPDDAWDEAWSTLREREPTEAARATRFAREPDGQRVVAARLLGLALVERCGEIKRPTLDRDANNRPRCADFAGDFNVGEREWGGDHTLTTQTHAVVTSRRMGRGRGSSLGSRGRGRRAIRRTETQSSGYFPQHARCEDSLRKRNGRFPGTIQSAWDDESVGIDFPCKERV
jgi:hypothetical protein